MIDFVAVGHVTLDETPTGTRPGGAALYAVWTAYRLGLRAALLTSCADDFPADALPPGLALHNVPSPLSTIYEIGEWDDRRRLRLAGRAVDLEDGALPHQWQRAPIALLCPVANEVDPALAAAFPEASLGVAPQGWMRRRDAEGAIAWQPWADAEAVLAHAQVLVMGEEDIGRCRDEAMEWVERVPVAAVTHGRRGATLFVNGEPYHVEADPASEVDSIGAGDVFATALLVEYHRGGDAWEAAALAACAAAACVEGRGPMAMPDRTGLETRLAAYRRRRGG